MQFPRGPAGGRARGGGFSKRSSRRRPRSPSSGLAGAGLLIHSLERLERLDLGFNPSHLSVFSITYPLATYDSAARVAALGREVLPILRATPGATALSTVEARPFMGADFGWSIGLVREGGSARNTLTLVAAPVGGPHLFRTLGIPLIRGRGFLASDDEHAAPVAVVSRALAEELWPGENPIGRRVGQLTRGTVTWRTVVGEVGDAHLRALRVATPIGRALRVIALGGAAGLLGALASSRVLVALLFQVQPADPVSLGAACLLLGLVALAAAYLPARRAMRVDPAIALRSE